MGIKVTPGSMEEALANRLWPFVSDKANGDWDDGFKKGILAAANTLALDKDRIEKIAEDIFFMETGEKA